MDPRIKKLLKPHYVDSVFHTHVSLVKPKGRYNLGRSTLEDFWSTYCGIAEEEETILGLAEKPQQYLPVLVDVDLKLKDEGGEIGDKLYTEEQLKTIVELYQNTLRKIVDGCTEQELTCVVLEKDMYQQTRNENVYFKNGFHLHFPYIFMDKIDQELQVIPRVQQALKELDLFSNLGLEDSGAVIDKACCKVPWLIYGSRKSEDAQPYKVTKIYNCNLEEITLEKAFRNYQIFDSREQLIPLHGKVKHYLPRILSINSFHRPVKNIKRGTISPLKEKLRKERKSSASHRRIGVEEALTMAKKLLPMLSEFRAEDRNEWMTIGWLLFNITDGHPDGLELWCEFSSRVEDKYDENVCIYQWEHMVKKDLTIGTLRYYAKTDNPEEYKKFKEEQMEKHLIASVEGGSHNDVAKILFEDYGDEFVCASFSNKVWFQFVNHKWEQIEEGVFLREKISGTIIQRYVAKVKKLYDQINEATKEQAELIQSRIKNINKMIGNLKNSSYKNNIMKEASEVFYDQRFKDKLDSDAFLIAFNNGVYDLKQNIFRPGRPEDFLSKSMPVNYVQFTEDDERILEVNKFLQQVFPDKSVRNYFLDVSSDIFVGGNHEKIVVFWTGDGDNGKSVTQHFFDKMLGKLSVKLNTNVVTGKKPSAGSAFADLARVGGGVRLAVLEEPDSDEVINPGIFKHLSGNDSFYARDLFERGKDGREITPMFKLIFICNRLPRIKASDKAVTNRIRVIPFEATFCRPGKNPAPDSYEEQMKQKRFPMDKNFSKKIPTLVEAFSWILLQHRIKIANQPRVEPEKVRVATEMYCKQNDIYRQFIEESIIEDQKKIISLAEIYNLFKDWFRDGLPGNTLPVKSEVEDYFVRIWGSPEVGKKWKGYRQRTLQDDIASGDVVILDESDLVDYSEESEVKDTEKENKALKEEDEEDEDIPDEEN